MDVCAALSECRGGPGRRLTWRGPAGGRAEPTGAGASPIAQAEADTIPSPKTKLYAFAELDFTVDIHVNPDSPDACGAVKNPLTNTCEAIEKMWPQQARRPAHPS